MPHVTNYARKSKVFDEDYKENKSLKINLCFRSGNELRNKYAAPGFSACEKRAHGPFMDSDAKEDESIALKVCNLIFMLTLPARRR